MILLSNLKKIIRRIYIDLKNDKKRLKNSNFSIICNDCLGGHVYHDLKMKFYSPTINYCVSASDYIKFLKKLKEYLNADIEEVKTDEYDYPIAKLIIKDDFIICRLIHYKTFDEFKTKYKERAKRVNFDNLYILYNDRNDFSIDNLREFDNLDYKNKVCFTHIKHDEFKSAFYVKGSENDNCVKPLMLYKSKLSIKRYYDDFDFISFLNSK